MNQEFAVTVVPTNLSPRENATSRENVAAMHRQVQSVNALLALASVICCGFALVHALNLGVAAWTLVSHGAGNINGRAVTGSSFMVVATLAFICFAKKANLQPTIAMLEMLNKHHDIALKHPNHVRALLRKS